MLLLGSWSQQQISRRCAYCQSYCPLRLRGGAEAKSMLSAPMSCSPSLSQLRQVLVTGAGGRTGKLVLQKLLGRPEQFEARGLVRTAEVGLSLIISCLCSQNCSCCRYHSPLV